MEVQNISGPDLVTREFSVESAPRQENAPEEEVRTERVQESETKGTSVDVYA